MSEDITFCDNPDCNNMKCERNSKHIKQYWLDHSYAMFPDCSHYNKDKADCI